MKIFITNCIFKLNDKLDTCPTYITGTGVQQETGAELNGLLQCKGGTENLVDVAKFPKDNDNWSLSVAFHDNVVSAIPGRANTFCILPHNGSHSLMETHTRKEIVEQNHHARFRRINGPVWYNIHYLISFAYWTYWLLNEDDFSIIHQPYGLESPPPLSPSFVLSGNQLSQRSCPDVGKCKKQKLTTLVLPYASLGGTKITSVRDFQQLVGPSQNDAPKFGKTSTAP